MAWKIDRLSKHADLRHNMEIPGEKNPRADLLNPYFFGSNGRHFMVGLDAETDGASIPRPLLWVFGDKMSRYNLYAAIIHDGCYSCDIYIFHEGRWVPVYISADQADALFRAARKESGGIGFANWSMWAGIRLNSTLFEKARDLFKKPRDYPSLADFHLKHPEGIELPVKV